MFSTLNKEVGVGEGRVRKGGGGGIRVVTLVCSLTTHRRKSFLSTTLYSLGFGIIITSVTCS